MFCRAKKIGKCFANESFEHLVEFTGTSQKMLKIREPLTVVRNQIEVNKNEPVPLTNSDPRTIRSLITPFICKFTQDG